MSKPYMILTPWMFHKPPRGVKSLCTTPALMPNSTATIRTILRLAICAIALAVPSAAFADCGHDIIDQAYKGKITKHYSQACYNTAIRIEPVDGSSYSDIDSIIRDAKRADALRARDAAVVSTPAGNSDTPRTQSGNHSSSTGASSTPVVSDAAGHGHRRRWPHAQRGSRSAREHPDDQHQPRRRPSSAHRLPRRCWIISPRRTRAICPSP